MAQKEEKVLVEIGMRVFGKNYFDGMQKMTLNLEQVHVLQKIMMEAQAKWQQYNEVQLK